VEVKLSVAVSQERRGDRRFRSEEISRFSVLCIYVRKLSVFNIFSLEGEIAHDQQQ